MTQTTQHILMVRPAAFGYNAITAQNNAFQHTGEQLQEESSLQEKALAEFQNFTNVLREAGVHVIEIFDTPEPKKPDAIFPNNWFTSHADNTLILYPMYAENRRWERRRGIIELLEGEFIIENEIDFSHFEEDHKFLEGTGSMIFDRVNKICYACLSERTEKSLLELFAEKTGYQIVAFHASDEKGTPIYHTNVMMAMATDFAVVCLESIQSSQEKEDILEQLKKTHKAVIDVSLTQMKEFTCNVLEVENAKGERFLVMSERAYKHFTEEQKTQIRRFTGILKTPLTTIEHIGGGGARCMMAEVFFQPRH
ncbi:arginine deiminase-related protein [Rapidithrix thailandica]|uniref:Arginine deiminase-related protein n=1 Tax=Rapidithrix thailandica TaxID=413964 RepID=A0AAW9S838_9BACT